MNISEIKKTAMKYPVGIQTFENIIEDGFVYVDKTDLVYKLATEGKVYFLSRPRRFGKSLLVSTLKNYFLGKKELFKGLKIDALEKEWIEYPVFMLSFGTSDYTQGGTLEVVLEDFVQKHEKAYGVASTVDDISIRFRNILSAVHEKTGRRAVVLVDEYDKPLLDVMELDSYTTDSNGTKVRIEDHNRNILKGFYGVFKDADEHLKFVLLTGVTKFSQVSVFSGFNQPQDISMDRRYETLCGITTDELTTVFDESIKELAECYKVGHEEMMTLLKNKYDGYHFCEQMTDIYNPFSLLNCFSKREMGEFWFASGSPTYLIRLLQHCKENINELVGKYYDASEFVNYKANVQQPLPMIYQSGYFTIKNYNPRRNTYLLDFPNEEVRKGFVDALAADYFRSPTTRPSSWLNDVQDALEEGDADLFMKLMTSFLSSTTYRFQRKDDAMECERYFHYTFFLIMQMMAHYSVVAERETSQGRIDCVVECPGYVYILEFKLNGSAHAALQQIKDKGYASPYLADKRKVVMIGINFSSDTGTVGDYIAEIPVL